MLARLLLRIVLRSLATLMSLRCRISPRFRAALSRNRILVVETQNGVAYQFVIHNRHLRGCSDRPSQADFRLRFTTATQALGVLLSPKSVGRVVLGILDQTIEHEGSLVLLLWFDGRIQRVAPLREAFRRPERFPCAYLEPSSDSAVADQITREPPVAELDPDWRAAWEQRNNLLMMRVAAGEPHPEI